MSPRPHHELVLQRAREHFESLQQETARWLEGEHYEVIVKPDDEWPGYSAVFIRGEDPPNYPTSAIIGDCLHNLRSSLDLLVYELAASYTKPLPDNFTETSEFPIFGDRSKNGKSGMGSALFRDNGLRKIRGINPLAQAEIQRLQPYHCGPAYTEHPLWVLHELDRVSKHRLLHTVAAFSNGLMINSNIARRLIDHAKITPSPGVGQPLPVGTARYRLEAGCIEVVGGIVTQQETRFFRLPIPTDIPEAEVKMNLNSAMGIAFRDITGSAEPQFVVELLARLYNYIATEVLPPIEPYL